jgi:protein-disulfide isomerase
MEDMIDGFEENVQVAFKHYPLEQQCNSKMGHDLHPQACEAAYAAEAARKQGKFWEFHDAVFAADLSRGDEVLVSIAADIGLDTGQFNSDRNAKETIDKVRSDTDLANTLGVNATPTTFWNGRQVRGLNPELAQLLMEQQGLN